MEKHIKLCVHVCVYTYEGKEMYREGKERTTVGKHVQKLDLCVLWIYFKMVHLLQKTV